MKLHPGESYAVQVTVTNRSQHAGEPAGADLTIAIEAALDGVDLIPLETFEGWYEPGEAKANVWEFTVPVEIATSSGAIVVEVRDPSGRRIAQASASIEVEGEEPGPETDVLTLAELVIDRNYIYVVAQGVEPDGRYMWLRTQVYRLNGTYYGATRKTAFWNGKPTYTNTYLKLEGPDYDPYPYIICSLHDGVTGEELVTRTFEGPFYAE